MKLHSHIRLAGSLVATLALAACGESAVETAPLQVSLQVEAPPAAFADACGYTLESARIVLREVELDRDDEDETNEPEDVEVGPYLIDLTSSDFNGTIRQGFLQATLPVGTYDEVEFDVHKLDDDDADDLAAAEADPSGLGEMLSADLSIRIAGTGSSGAFAFESDLNEEQERPVLVTVGDAVEGIDNITLSIDPSAWFLDGGTCLDPNDAGDAEAIEDVIKSSIDVEEDDDVDGEDDEGPGST